MNISVNLPIKSTINGFWNSQCVEQDNFEQTVDEAFIIAIMKYLLLTIRYLDIDWSIYV